RQGRPDQPGPHHPAGVARSGRQIGRKNLEGNPIAGSTSHRKSAVLAVTGHDRPGQPETQAGKGKPAMSHELEQLANGQTAFVTARVPAWHQLGTVTDDCMTAEDVMAKAFLGGWKVRKIDLQGVETTPDGVSIIECPDRRMTVRTNIFTGQTEYLGIVGTDYGTVQNEEAAEVLNRLVDESGAHFETAGSLRGGRM